MTNTFLQIRKASTFLSRDVSCRFEPTIVDIFCVVIELISLGVGFSRGFLEDITVRNQKRRLNNRMIEIKNQPRTTKSTLQVTASTRTPRRPPGLSRLCRCSRSTEASAYRFRFSFSSLFL